MVALYTHICPVLNGDAESHNRQPGLTDPDRFHLKPTLQGQGERAYKVVWTAQEQRDLEAAMTRFPEARYPPLERYLRIAASLPQKVGGSRQDTLQALAPLCWKLRASPVTPANSC